jgi:hypothetical protein
MHKFVLLSLFLGTTLQASQFIDDPNAYEAELNIAEVSYNIVVEDMGVQDWNLFVKSAEKRFNEWSEENNNTSNVKRFLDDQLIILAPRVTSGNANNLKDFCKWLALYNVFSEPLPRYIRDIKNADKKWIQAELADFNWARSAQRIKERAR